jgi:trehalose/maltose transport system permease protein
MTANAVMKSVAFYALVVMIALFSVFPFYYAIVTSFATGTGLFENIYWHKQFSWANCEVALGGRAFPRNILNSVFVATSTVVFGWSSGCFWRWRRPIR